MQTETPYSQVSFLFLMALKRLKQQQIIYEAFDYEFKFIFVTLQLGKIYDILSIPKAHDIQLCYESDWEMFSKQYIDLLISS